MRALRGAIGEAIAKRIVVRYIHVSAGVGVGELEEVCGGGRELVGRRREYVRETDSGERVGGFGYIQGAADGRHAVGVRWQRYGQ